MSRNSDARKTKKWEKALARIIATTILTIGRIIYSIFKALFQILSAIPSLLKKPLNIKN